MDRVHAREIAQAIGFDINHQSSGGGSDGNFTGALGITTLDGLGVQGAMAHTLEEHVLIDSLVPDNIAKQVSSYLFKFASKASRMGWMGALVLLASALTMVLTIDRKLNDIWRVRKMRPLTQRVLVQCFLDVEAGR